MKSCIAVDVNTDDLDGIRDINVFDNILSVDIDDVEYPHEFVYWNKEGDEAYFR